MKKATNEEIISTYEKTKSVWKVAEKFGMCGQSVHERLNRLGIEVNGGGNKFTKKDYEILRKEYISYRDKGKLGVLAKKMGRHKTVIVAYAEKIGLTNQNHKKRYLSTWKYMTKDNAEKIFEKFKNSSLGMGRFCKKSGYDDLGFSNTMKKYFSDEWEHVIELKAPKQSMYRLGRAFEYRCRDYLRKKGFIVFRSPASKSPIDLCAIRKGQILFIQCKRGGSFYYVDEWNIFYNLAISVGALPILAGSPEGRGIKFYRVLGEKKRDRKKIPMIEIKILEYAEREGVAITITPIKER